MGKKKAPDGIIKPLVLDGDGNMLDLNKSQLMFANYYLETNNATKAALMAGYSPNDPAAAGCHLLQIPAIRTYIASRSKTVLESIGIRQERIANELAKLAFSNTVDLFNDDWTIKDPNQLSKSLQRAIQGVKVRTRTTTRGESVEETKEVEVKMYDKIKPLLALAEMSGMIKKEEAGTVINNNTYIDQLDTFYVENVKK
jgi:phage terminase small subunit